MTIATEIEDLLKEQAKNEERLEEIERLGRLKDLSEEELRSLKIEKKQLEHDIEFNKKKLRSLRWENLKSMIVSVVILGVLYGLYVAYTSTREKTAGST